MDITIAPGPLHGTVEVIPSKSQAHRILICTAFADKATAIHCRDTNRDIEATVDCLNALGAEIERTEDGYLVNPVTTVPERAVLNCCESGSTLRFMLPIAGALGIDATFQLAGRLPYRPLSPLWEEMERMGCTLTRLEDGSVTCTGKLKSGSYRMDGGVSSQFISGLLLALPLIDGECSLEITGKVESVPYIELTKDVISMFNHPVPQTLLVEGDWSNGAFFLAAQALGSNLEVTNLNSRSVQGDKAVAVLLPRLLAENCTVSAADIPDLIPILSIVAAARHGATFTQIERLRLKESDRVDAIISMLTALGGKAEATENTLTVYPAKLSGGTVDGYNDHRIVMSAAIASTVCEAPVTILGADAVNKSYPHFWAEFRRLGGHYEQHLR